MIRTLLAVLFLSAPAIADADNEMRERLKDEKKKFDADMKTLGVKIDAAFKKQEDDLRASKTITKAALDRLTEEKALYVEQGIVPAWLPLAMTQQLNQLSGDLEEVYESAVKLCRKTGRDKLAAEIEKELEAIWAMKWRHIDYKDAGKLKDGHISLTVKEGIILTKVVYSGPIEITVTARTEDENIRINAYNGSVIIFNWELNKSEFRVARPTGTPDKLESGSHLGVKAVPLEPNKWHTFRWRITSKGMEVYDNGRLVWSERRAYPVENMKGPIIMRRMNSAVDVEEIQVRQLDDAD